MGFLCESIRANRPDSRESICANRPDSHCESPAHLSSLKSSKKRRKSKKAKKRRSGQVSRFFCDCNCDFLSQVRKSQRFWAPKVSLPPRKPCDFSLRRKIASDCDFVSIFRGRPPLSEDAMGGGGKRGGRKTSRMTPLPKMGFGPPPPPRMVRFPPPSGVVALFVL